MAILPEQTHPEEEDLSLYEQIAEFHVILHLLSEGTPETPPAKAQPKPEIADRNEGLEGEYGVNVD